MELYNGLPLLKISVSKEKHGVDKISLVEEPAIEEDFLYFKKESEEITSEFAQITEEQKLAGAFLIPDKPILRRDKKTGKPFYVSFTAEVIKQIAEKFNKNLYGKQFNIDHAEEVKDVYVIENWIKETEEDKSFSKYGFKLPVGSWFGIVKVDNTELWNNKIKTGEVKGFSVELFAGLKFSIDSQLIEDHAIKVLESEEIGEDLPEGAVLVAEEDIDENEGSLTAEDILAKHLEDLSEEFAIKGSNPTKSSSFLDTVVPARNGKYLIRYKYFGVYDEKNRNFCRRMLNFQRRFPNRVFRKEDINIMSFNGENKEFGIYSIFRYKGSYGCRHKFKRLIYFLDFEDKETRKVGNVPAVTNSINDKEARTINSNLNKEKMNEVKTKFETVAELPAEARVVGAEVDDENGTYEVEGFVYTVEGGVITEVTEVQTEAEGEGETAPEELSLEVFNMFKEGVVAKLSELEAKVNELASAMSGDDSTSAEQFSKEDLKEMLEEFSSKLKPAEDSKEKEEVVVLSKEERIFKALESIEAKKKQRK